MTPPPPPSLELAGIAKRFGGVVALDGVSLVARAGEVHAVMGENGAGKSTLMKIAAGLHRPDAGSLAVAGVPAAFSGPADAQAAGIRTVFQELTVLSNLDVAANLTIGAEPVRAGGFWRDVALQRAQAQAILDRFDLPLSAEMPAARLSAGQRQMVEIARAAARDPKVLILDEPTSSLGRAEEERLFALVDRLRAAGVAILYITHRMSEVFRLSDRITVLRDGRHVATGPAPEFDRARLIRAMVGRALAGRAAGRDSAGLPVALRVTGVSRPPAVRGVELDLRAGEVLGLAGLMGAGRTELARLMAGADRPAAGAMTLFGAPFAPRDVAAAMAAGVAYLSEDRKTLGLILSRSIADNIALPSLSRLTRSGFLRPGAIRALARTWMARLAIRAPGPAARVDTLSGGNQQKVALARCLATEPRVILLDEPTRGVDVGAKAEIHGHIRDLAGRGAAVLVISSELPELLQLADRIAVMARGRIAGTVPAAGATEEALLSLAFDEGRAA